MARSLLCSVLALLLMAAPLATEADAGTRAQRTKALVQRLKTQRIANLKFEDTKLTDVVKWLRVATSHNFVFRRGAISKADIDLESITIRLKLRDVTVAQVLDLCLRPHELAAVVKDNIVFITTKADSYGKLRTKLYGISHITYTKRDFIAPELSLRTDGQAGLEEYEPEVEVENDPLNNGDAVADLLRRLLDPEGWENNDWEITATDRHLSVRAPLHIHRQIPKVLEQIASVK